MGALRWLERGGDGHAGMITSEKGREKCLWCGCDPHGDICPFNALANRGTGKLARLRKALKEFGYVVLNDPNEAWHSNDCEGDCETRASWYSARCRKARAALGE